MAIYSKNVHCKAFLGRKFLSSKILIVFEFVLQKSGHHSFIRFFNENTVITQWFNDMQ